MSIFTSNAAAVNQGQSIITCTDNSDFSGVPSGSVVIINNDHLAVVDSGTAASSNNSTLTLRSPWPSDLPDITAGKLFVLAGAPAIAEAVKSTLTVSQTLTTTKQALQAIIDAQGTAATADLTTSATDTTSGRVYKVGDNVGIEYGTNANGSYTKFPDGTLVCTHEKTTDSGIDVPSASIYTTDSTSWSFPFDFVYPPSFQVAVKERVTTTWGGFGSSAVNNTTASFRAFRSVASSTPPLMSLFAIGRWK